MMRMLFAMAIALGLVMPSARAEDPKIEGDWEGTMKVTPQASLRMVFHIKKSDGKLSATFDSPDQGAGGIAVDSVSQEKDTVVLVMKALRGEYKGKIAADGSSIDGTWTQGGMDFPLVLKPAKAAVAPDQLWEGTLSVNGGIELRLVVNLYKNPDKPGEFTATMDSPDQGAKGIKADSVSLDKKSLKFAIKAIMGEFSGELDEAGTTAKGTWTQAGNKMPLTLKKTDKVSEVRRPQLPQAPFPYKATAVTYPNKEAGHSLAGTLTLPEGKGPFPVVVLISGSGAQDRDETLLGHKPFLVLADYLTRRGIGVLRADDRGVGGSTGDHSTATSADFATDIEAGVAYLKTRDDVNPKKIGLMGHSEGGLIAPMVAAKDPEGVAFVVMLAGPGVPGDEILMEQSALILKAMGKESASPEKDLADAKKMYDVIKTEKDDAKAGARLAEIVKDSLARMTDAERKELGDDPEKTALAQMKPLQTPWFRYFLTYDPRPTLAKVKCPVLAINGEKDLQVPPQQNLPEIERAIRSNGNAQVTIKELPGLNHLFQTTKTGAPSEYGRIEETFSPDALKLVGDWILGLE